MTKQVIVVRKDLKMKKGKMTAQGSHSSLGVFLQMMNNGKSLREEMPEVVNGSYSLKLDVTVGSDLDNWLRGVFRKITLAVNSEEELMDIYYKAKERDLPVVLIEDSGLTVFNGVKTKTCLAIGPYNSEEIDKITGHLPLMS